METRPEEVATLAAGCFWCVEAVFEQLRGVSRVESGYSGGTVQSPTYEQVCTGTTGHAEVLQVHFDPAEISFSDLLDVFFTIHDPTTLNCQGEDVGTQYRSAIFYHSDDQRAAAESVIEQVARAGIWADPIVTEVTPFEVFFPAEEYHHEYFRQNPAQPYCRAVIAPKVARFRKQHMARLAE
jgi:peptide-methionine (S)-S-oxide reductase